MPTSSYNKRFTQFSYSMRMSSKQKATAAPTISTQATLSTSTRECETQKHHLSRRRATKPNVTELLPPLTSISSTRIVKSFIHTLPDKDVENMQVTTYRTDIPQLSQSQRQHPLSTNTITAERKATAKRTTSYLPTLATAAEESYENPYLSIKMPLRHLILAIMTVVVFSVEFTMCTSTILQQQLTTLSLLNNTHLPTDTTNKSTNNNDNLKNYTFTSTLATIKSAAENSFLSSSSVSSSSATSTSSPPLPVTAQTRALSQPLESAALVQKSSLTTSTLDDTSSNIQSFQSGMGTFMHTESPTYTSLQWEVESQDDSTELSHSTSVLNTYDTSDLPPLSEAEQAAKDLLTKGFSIPTYLPPFPVFAVADLPAYLNTVSTTTTGPPISNLRPSDGYSTNSQENISYLDNLQDHQVHRLQNHRKLYIPRRNTSAATTTVQVGNQAYLPCHIHRLQNKPVSWVRLRDGHIISVDQTTFIADQRFQAIFHDDKEFTWSLQIKYVQQTDEGWYECQASSEPKMSAKVYLKVVVPQTELIGDQSRFVKAGSKVALHCIVRGTLDPPQYIIWYRDKTQIGENNIMGWYTQLDRNIFGNSGDSQNTIGSLIIPFVRKMDSGNYTCQPSNSASVSVDLHVLSGEYSASAIMSAARTHTINSGYLLLLLSILMLLHRT